MTKEKFENIVRGITDKIESTTVDIDDWAEFWGFTREDYEEFLEMPIKSLEQEPCEDAVSREAVLKEIPRLWNSDGDKDYCMETLKDFVTELPSVASAQRWISVKERLPETDGDYLLFGKIDDFDDEYYKFIGEFDAAAEKFGICRDCFDPNTLGCLGSEFYEYGEVLAWMPLPDDYTEGTK
jgi:hypothetical protein